MSLTPDCASAPAAPTDDDSADLNTALAALRGKEPRPGAVRRNPRSSHRALLGIALCGLLVGGIFAVRTADPESRSDSAGANPADNVYRSAHPGSCLLWQPGEPDRLSFVQCTTPHMFEVAKSFNGTDSEPCDLAVRKYLGERFDPDSKFSITELSPAGHPAEGSRKKLCGLQLPGPDGHPVPFRGQVAETDQSKVWPPGTCLGIDPKTSGPTGIAVDCTAPHAVEVIGAVDLGGQFHDAVPSDADQTAVLQDSCAHLAAAYLAPRTVASTGLKVIHHAIGPTSWGAGSRHAMCSLGPEQPGPITGRAASHHRETDDENNVAPTAVRRNTFGGNSFSVLRRGCRHPGTQPVGTGWSGDHQSATRGPAGTRARGHPDSRPGPGHRPGHARRPRQRPGPPRPLTGPAPNGPHREPDPG